jgi:hypothetical protein
MKFADYLVPRSGLMHNMTDDELLWRASMEPRWVDARMPDRVVAKVAFLFLVMADLPLRPLWENFFVEHQGLYSIYVHARPNYAGSLPVDSVFYGRMIPSQVTSTRLDVSHTCILYRPLRKFDCKIYDQSESARQRLL